MRVVAAFNRQTINLNTFNALQNTNTSNNIEAGRLNRVRHIWLFEDYDERGATRER